MQEHKPVPDRPDVLHHVRQISCEAEWTVDELRQAMREGGIEPDHFLDRVLTDVKRFMNDTVPAAPPESPPRPLLVALRQQTRLAPSDIAAAMAVPVPFLSMVSRHPNAVPASWRKELAQRAEDRLQIHPDVVMASFDAPFQYDIAAARATPYPADAVQHYQDILERSNMNPEARQFWQTLASNPPR
jgi:hypothetical protein